MSDIKIIKTTLNEHILCTLDENKTFCMVHNPLEIVENEKGDLDVRPYLMGTIDSSVRIAKTNILYIANPNEDSVKQYNQYLTFLKTDTSFQ